MEISTMDNSGIKISIFVTGLKGLGKAGDTEKVSGVKLLLFLRVKYSKLQETPDTGRFEQLNISPFLYQFSSK